jgi:predicted transport protein
MWICPICSREFANTNQVHSCRERNLGDFLQGKSAHTVELFDYLVEELLAMAPIKVYPTKSMIAFGLRTNFAYVTQLGKNFIDVVFPFNEIYADNLCFSKIKTVPGTNQHNHYFRMYLKEDINEEVRKYMRKSLTQTLSKGEGF